MSVDSTTLERSALERKDREELTTIAQALGAKPTSRARKAEIVQMILELTGVATPDDSAAKAGEPSGSSAPARKRTSTTARKKADKAEQADAGKADADKADADKADAGKAEPAGEAEPAAAGGDTTGGGDPAAGEAGPSQQSLGDWEAEAPSGGSPAASGRSAGSGRPAGGGGTPPGGGGAAAARGAGTANGRSATTATAGTGAPASTAGDATGAGGAGGEGTGGEGRRPQGRADQASPRGQNRDSQQQGQQQAHQQGRDQQQNRDQGEGQEPGGGRRRRRRGRRGGGDQQPQPEEFTGEPVVVAGLLDLRDEGYGFLRVNGYLPSKDDIYVSVKQARQFGLRKGDHIAGASRPALRNEKNPALLRIDKVNGQDPDQAKRRRRFEDLTPLFPDTRLRLETADSSDMTARIVDLIAPIGKGQRGLIVSPPKAGKTSVMKQVARSIESNNPEVVLMVLLVDERPEEVTDMRRWLRNPTSEVVASTFDRPADEHTAVSELTIERAKRLVEEGRDVCIILDGITRLARAYNLAAPATGRIMSGGVDSGALYPPKRFFGAARNLEEGGSLTILATALIETGSKMDEVIFEEFKGTGNMELRLDRRLAERRIYPAIDVDASSTRHEELLFEQKQLKSVWGLRRALQNMSAEGGGNGAALDLLMDRLKTFRTNEQFLAEVSKK